MKKYIFSMLVILLLTACTTNSTRSNWAVEEYERMIEPTNTGDNNYHDYEATTPEKTLDSDMDGWNDDFDLCPDEASEKGLAGCVPLSINSEVLGFTLWYQLPIDPSGRINVFGDRFLVLTNYELGELQIYDLANGELLRNFRISDMLNDSPTLLPQGIILKNYDQQRWRLLDYNGDEIYAANEELEIISEENNLLISRANNTIFLRKLDHVKNISNQFAGRYVTFTPDGFLSITNSDACTITLLNIHNFTANESYLFKPGSTICYQHARYANDGQYLFFVENQITHLISLQNTDNHFSFPGVPMAQTSQSLLLLNENKLSLQQIPDGVNIPLLDFAETLVQKVVVNQNIAAVLTRDTETFQSNITLINLGSQKTETVLDAESIQFTNTQFYVWSFGDEKITFYNNSTLEERNQFETPAISAVQTALKNKILLVSGQDRQLYVYRPEVK